MKKVIFISALAIAAAVSCTKSDIVDTKFNEQISFENYIGRDAMTKATPYGSEALPESIGLYGYYLGTATTWTNTHKANLWENENLLANAGYATTTKRYWADDKDNYTFLAYAPATTTTNSLTDGSYKVTTGENGADPVINYTVPTNLTNQKDILYSNEHKLVQKSIVNTETKKVPLVMKHALSRITVKAKATKEKANDVYAFDVKEVKLAGKFITEDNFNLYNGTWEKKGTKTSTDVNYLFDLNGTTDANDKVTYTAYNENHALGTSWTDYSKTTYKTDGTVDTYGNNYLMVIPTNLEAADAVLTVVYTTTIGGLESTPYTKTFNVGREFAMGKAYSINLTFDKTTQAIEFSVSVEDWKENTPAEGDTPGDNHQQNENIVA